MLKSVEFLSETVNAPVVQLPGRRFPGVVVQGDTLFSLYELTCELAERLEGAQEEKELAAELRERVQELLIQYEDVLAQHGRPLPYPARITGSV